MVRQFAENAHGAVIRYRVRATMRRIRVQDLAIWHVDRATSHRANAITLKRLERVKA